MRPDPAPLLLGIAQTLTWAATFYLLPAMLVVLIDGTGFTKVQVTGAMTAALIVSALAARPCGRLIDAGHGPALLIGGNAVAAMALFACSLTDDFTAFAACWIVVGACMAACLYEPCFAVLTRHYGTDARRAITTVTLVAGFAGTLGYPLANWLALTYDWRVAMQAMAAIVLFGSVPTTIAAMAGLRDRRPPGGVQACDGRAARAAPARLPWFWLLTTAFTLGAVAHTMVIAHILPLLGERGVAAASAVVAAMLIGPAQVAGRLGLRVFDAHLSTWAVTMVCIGGLSAALLLLLGAGGSVWLIYGAALAHGAAWGLVSIVRPTLVREVFGAAGFGARSGGVATVAVLGIALAPSLGTWLWQVGGYDLMLVVGAGCAMTGTLMLAWLNRLVRAAQPASA